MAGAGATPRERWPPTRGNANPRGALRACYVGRHGLKKPRRTRRPARAARGGAECGCPCLETTHAPGVRTPSPPPTLLEARAPRNRPVPSLAQHKEAGNGGCLLGGAAPRLRPSSAEEEAARAPVLHIETRPLPAVSPKSHGGTGRRRQTANVVLPEHAIIISSKASVAQRLACPLRPRPPRSTGAGATPRERRSPIPGNVSSRGALRACYVVRTLTSSTTWLHFRGNGRPCRPAGAR